MTDRTLYIQDWTVMNRYIDDNATNVNSALWAKIDSNLWTNVGYRTWSLIHDQVDQISEHVMSEIGYHYG